MEETSRTTGTWKVKSFNQNRLCSVLSESAGECCENGYLMISQWLQVRVAGTQNQLLRRPSWLRQPVCLPSRLDFF